jgi:hypothetical protein
MTLEHGHGPETKERYMVIDHPNNHQLNLVRIMVAQKGLPEMLYKYREVGDFTDKILIDKQLWFSTPRKFNDPFDLQIADNGQYTEAELRDYLRSQSVPSRVAERIIEEDRVAKGKFVAESVEKARDQHMNALGVLSLSRRPDSVLMWTHYAGEHTGVALGFSVLDDPALFFTPVNIQYQADLPSLSFIRDGSNASNESLKRKAIDWKYEEEVRIYKSKPQAYPFNPQCLREVILGIRMKAGDIAHIMDLLDGGPFAHVKVKQGVVSKTKYIVETVDVARLAKP